MHEHVYPKGIEEYNSDHLHSALDYLSPNEFEEKLEKKNSLKNAAQKCLDFWGHYFSLSVKSLNTEYIRFCNISLSISLLYCFLTRIGPSKVVLLK